MLHATYENCPKDMFTLSFTIFGYYSPRIRNPGMTKKVWYFKFKTHKMHLKVIRDTGRFVTGRSSGN